MRLVTLLSGLVLFAIPASAEPVTYHFTGTVTFVTDGTFGSYDLRGQFANGQAVTMDMTVERATTGSQSLPYLTTYANPVTDLAATIGTYVFTGTNPFGSIGVVNDGPNAPIGPATNGSAFFDEFYGIFQGLEGNPIGTANLSDINFTFADAEGTALSDQMLPRIFPAMTNFETKQMVVSWVAPPTFVQGTVEIDFSGVSTPAQGTSWGRVKNLYRR